MSNFNKVAKNTGFLYGRMAITMFVSLYTTRLILDALGATDFGIFNLVGGAIAMLGFLNAAMSAATQRFMSFAEGKKDLERQKQIFNCSIVLHFAISLIIGISLLISGYFLFRGILNVPNNRVFAAKFIYYCLIASTLFTIMTVPYNATLNARENMLYYTVVGIIESFLKLLVAFIVVFSSFQDKLIIYGALMPIVSIFILTITRVYCHKNYPECRLSPFKYLDKKLMKEITGFGGWSFLGSTSSMLSLYGQGLVINVFFGTLVNAAQGISNQISGQIGTFSGSMLKALNPIIVKSEGSGDRKKMLKASISGAKFSFLLLSFFAIPILLETPFILKFWLKNFPDYSVSFCRLLIIINLIEQMFITLPVTISATGKIKWYQISVSSLAIIPILISFFLFKIGYPPTTIYYLFIGQRILRSFVILFFAKKYCSLSPKLFISEVILKVLILTFLVVSISLIPSYYFSEGFFRLLLVLGLSSFSFIILAFTLVLNNEEKASFIKLFFKMKGVVENIIYKLVQKIINVIYHRLGGKKILFKYFNQKIKKNFELRSNSSFENPKHLLYTSSEIVKNINYHDQSWDPIKNIGIHMWNNLFTWKPLEKELIVDENKVPSEIKVTIVEENKIICKSSGIKNDWVFLEFTQPLPNTYFVDFNARIFNSISEFQFAFNFIEIGRRYRFNLLNNKVLSFDVVDHGFFHNSLFTTSLSLELGKFYNFKILVTETHLSYLVDEKVVMSIKQKRNLLPGGSLAFIFWDSDKSNLDLEIENIEIYKI